MHGPNDPARRTAVSAVWSAARTAVSVDRDGASPEFVTLTTLRTDADSYVWELRPHALTSSVLLAPRPFQRWMFSRQRRGDITSQQSSQTSNIMGEIPMKELMKAFYWVPRRWWQMKRHARRSRAEKTRRYTQRHLLLQTRVWDGSSERNEFYIIFIELYKANDWWWLMNLIFLSYRHETKRLQQCFSPL